MGTVEVGNTHALEGLEVGENAHQLGISVFHAEGDEPVRGEDAIGIGLLRMISRSSTLIATLQQP